MRPAIRSWRELPQRRIMLNVRQNRRLAGLRDTLLPKLMSGEIEIPATETGERRYK